MCLNTLACKAIIVTQRGEELLGTNVPPGLALAILFQIQLPAYTPGKQQMIAQGLRIPTSHVRNLDGILVSLLEPGPAADTAAIWRVNLERKTFASHSVTCHSRK